MIKKKVAVLGSTGSVGTQVCDVCEKLGASVKFIAAHSNIGLLEQQIRKFSPEICAVGDCDKAAELRIAVRDTSTKIISGYDAMCEAVKEYDCDLVYNAISGKNGLLPTLSTLQSGKTLALANKESMVLAGHIVNKTASEHNAEILPVDSEHCAIFQCLKNGKQSEVKRILLTCSGGPFFGYSFNQLEHVRLCDTLDHPTWNMGKKITVDSATLANKGLEIIEAMHLFGMAPENIEILVHPQSIVHSAVEYADGAVIAQMGTPDMRLPIQYALTWPERLPCPAPRLDLAALGTLTFERPDLTAFRCLRLAVESAGRSMSACCAMNAANEIAVNRYLRGDLSFGGIYETAAAVTEKLAGTPADTLEEVLALDAEARRLAAELGVT